MLIVGNENDWIPGALLLSAKNITNCSSDYYHQDPDGVLFVPGNSMIVMNNAKCKISFKSNIEETKSEHKKKRYS
jgi:hypothetical protein